MQIARSSLGRTPRELMVIILVATLWAPVRVHAAAEDPGAARFSFSGFGTLGLVHSSENKADFTNTIRKPNGAGFTRAWSGDVDSRLGGQITADVNPEISAVLQVIVEQNADKTYRPHVEWANIRYQVTPDFSVRIGRTVLSSFMFSDTPKVGYANPWVRPPVEVYNLVPGTSSDGVDASYELHFGEVIDTLRGSFGRTDGELPARLGGGSATARRLWLISDTVDYGAATARISYQELHLTIPLVNELLDAFRQFGPQGTALADRYDQRDKLVTFLALGAMYNPGKWFVLGEWGHTDFRSAIGDSTAWYVSGGYRLAKFTPYLTYAQVSADSNRSDPGLTVSALPPFLAGPATGLNAGLNALLNSIAVQRTLTVGARWDFMRNVDLKLQFDHTRLGADSAGSLINVQPGFRPGGSVNLFSVAIDFVF